MKLSSNLPKQINLKNREKEATIRLYVHSTDEISVEVTPYIGDIEVVSVYYRTILADPVIAIDLKGAFKRFLVKENLMNEEDAICEVYYQSMHPSYESDVICATKSWLRFCGVF